MSDTKIICISGKARHGKDTVAEYLKCFLESENRRVAVIHNGDLVKFVCSQLFGWDGEKDDHGRRLLQYVGTDVVRKRRPDYWVDFIISLLELFPNEWDYILIPDCRFPNEIDRFRENDFHTIHVRVERPDFDNGLSEEAKNHVSETALDATPCDYILKNSGDTEYLKHLVAMFLGVLLTYEEPNG